MARSKKRQSRRQKRSRRGQPEQMLLSNYNYKLILIGVVMIVLGYAIMYFEHDVDGFLSLYVAPLILLGGYLEIIYALLWRPKEAREADESFEKILEDQPAEAQEA